VDELKQYKITYTEAAEEDIFSKAEYIEKAYHDSDLAYKWYIRLRAQIQKDLSFLPYKYQPYPAGAWAEKGVREFILRNDIVLYSVDEQTATVLIHAVFTRGKNIAEDILEE
jgi:plasmid stabilization system protein ParE